MVQHTYTALIIYSHTLGASTDDEEDVLGHSYLNLLFLRFHKV